VLLLATIEAHRASTASGLSPEILLHRTLVAAARNA
jgi:hypothetical protein